MVAGQGALDGQTAFVTGASSGLGAHFARVLAGAGARVVAAARRTDRLGDVVSGIERAGGKAFALALDVNAVGTFERALDEAEARLGPIDILVNNAGMNTQGLAVDLTEERFDDVMTTNVKGAFFLSTALGRRMIKRKQKGRIINIASVGSTHVLHGLSVYCMSKAAVAMMTRSLAREWARFEINVNALCPGYIETEINSDWFKSEGGQKQIAGWPRRRLAEAAGLDDALLLLAGPGGRFMTGSLVTVDDGQYI